VAFTLGRRALAGELLTAPHRGHLYQVAQRSGVPTVGVTLVYWGFAGFGGLCALGFLAADADVQPFIPLLVLVPQLFWLGYVVQSANRAGVGRWG
jgi:UDP-GlcNAc:undecaprenyl-phosphate/decaprenyl-phosphate GlcNAc-1-phosphate transferase